MNFMTPFKEGFWYQISMCIPWEPWRRRMLRAILALRVQLHDGFCWRVFWWVAPQGCLTTWEATERYKRECICISCIYTNHKDWIHFFRDISWIVGKRRGMRNLDILLLRKFHVFHQASCILRPHKMEFLRCNADFLQETSLERYIAVDVFRLFFVLKIGIRILSRGRERGFLTWHNLAMNLSSVGTFVCSTIYGFTGHILIL